MLFVLINILVIIVVGAILFLPNRQVRSGWTAREFAEDTRGVDLPGGDPAAPAAGV